MWMQRQTVPIRFFCIWEIWPVFENPGPMLWSQF
jgi:hypothetical protein